MVFRCVLANPLTSREILQDILKEQKYIARTKACRNFMDELQAVCGKAPLTAVKAAG